MATPEVAGLFSEVPYDEPIWWRRHMWRVLGHAAHFSQHAFRELRKRKFNYSIGVFSCFLVVLVAAVADTMIARAPVAFLNQAESEHAQVDARLTPSEASEASFLNLTQIHSNLDPFPSLSYLSGRNTFHCDVYGAACLDQLAARNVTGERLQDVDWRYDGFDCTSPALYHHLVLMRSEAELRMGLGRKWPWGPLKPGEVLVSVALARQRNITVGQPVVVRAVTNSAEQPLLANMFQASLDLTTADYYRSGLCKNGTTECDEVVSSLTVEGHTVNISASRVDELFALASKDLYNEVVLIFTVVGLIDDGYGRFTGDEDGDLVVVEASTFPARLCTSLALPFLDWGTAVLNDTSTHAVNASAVVCAALGGPAVIDWFVDEVVVNMPPDRLQPYMTTNYEAMQRTVIGFLGRVLYFGGFPEVDVEMGVLDTMSILRFFSLFLGLILSVILTILVVLSMLLIYSLLLMSIQTRTFELGVHRMLGMSRVALISMLLTQALSFALPAWALGLLMAQWIVQSILTSLERSIEIPVDKSLTSQAILLASMLGLFIPVLSAIFPIRTALSETLQSSIDTKHSKTQAVKVTIERASTQKFSPTTFVLGVTLTVVGFLIYYLVPLSLLTLNLALFFNIFFAILLGMLFGLILLSLNFEHLMETLVSRVFFWWETRSLRTLVLKNLVAHRQRNRKTTLMFALAVGFIVFITISYRVEITSADFRAMRFAATPMFARAESENGLFSPKLATSLEALCDKHDAVRTFSWVSERLGSSGELLQAYVTNLGRITTTKVDLYAVSPNFFNIAYSQFLIAKSQRSIGSSLSEQLYDVVGSQSFIVSSGMKSTHYLHSLGLSGSFSLARELGPTEQHPNTSEDLIFSRLLPLAFMDSVPRFLMGRFPESKQDVVMSLPLMAKLGNVPLEELSMSSLQIVFHANASSAAIDAVYDDLVESTASVDTEVYDERDFKKALAKTSTTMTLIFGVATYIAMGLCAFSLLASMHTNIFEQAKEIAVLRAMGLKRVHVVRLYIAEAFVLVVAAAMLGVCIGTFLGYTMMLQRILFTQLPITIQYPYEIIVLVVVGAVIISIASSLGPARALTGRSIAATMRVLV